MWRHPVRFSICNTSIFTYIQRTTWFFFNENCLGHFIVCLYVTITFLHVHTVDIAHDSYNFLFTTLVWDECFKASPDSDGAGISLKNIHTLLKYKNAFIHLINSTKVFSALIFIQFFFSHQGVWWKKTNPGFPFHPLFPFPFVRYFLLFLVCVIVGYLICIY